MEEIIRLPNALIGIAGVHLVVSQLTLRGLIAMPTIRNTAGIDILVSEPDESGLANLQVKTSMKKVSFWPTSDPEKCLKGPNSFYVFLRYLKNEQKFEIFLERGDRVTEEVTRVLEDCRNRGIKEFSCWYLPQDEEEKERLRQNWERWRPPKIASLQ